LQDDRFRGSVERVLQVLLDGSLGSEWEGAVEAEVQWDQGSGKGKQKTQDEEKGEPSGYDIAQRRNVFDKHELEVMRVRKQHVG
jgi:hypothetical protein